MLGVYNLKKKKNCKIFKIHKKVTVTFNCISGLLCSLSVALCNFTVLNLIYLSHKLNQKKRKRKTEVSAAETYVHVAITS